LINSVARIFKQLSIGWIWRVWNGQWGFKLVPSGDSLVPVLDATMRPSTTKRFNTSQSIALKALDEALLEHGQLQTGNGWPPNCKTVSLDLWRQACNKQKLTSSDKPDSQLKAFKRAREGLSKEQLVCERENMVWRCSED